MLLAGIGNHIDQVTAIAKSAQLVDSEEGRTRKIGLHAEDAVEFDRMSDGFVNLQAKLRAVKNNVEHAFGRLICLMKRYGFFGNAPRVVDQLQLFDQFVAFVLPLSPK